MTAPTGKARRTFAPRRRAKPTTGQVEHVDPQLENLTERLADVDWGKMFGRPKQRHTPEVGERALRKSIVLAKRRAARERAYANGRRR